MKKFRFPLERVLAYRRLAAEAEQARLEQRLAVVHRIDEEIVALQRSEAGEQDNIRLMEAPQSPVSTGAVGNYTGYRKALVRDQAALQTQRQAALVQAEQQRMRAVSANQAKELLERAREIALERWKTDLDREIETTAAELYLARWNSKSRR